MKQKILILTSMIMWTCTGLAQLPKSEYDEYESMKRVLNDTISINKRDQTGLNIYAASSIIQDLSDESVAYYQHVVKQWGWYVGIGPALTKEEASHLNVVYKLSHKNDKGHWMKLEAVDGYGSYTTDHRIETYIASSSDNDSTVNAGWKDKLASVCQWEMVPDGSGDKVFLERAYDAQKNLVYHYQPVFISGKELIGSYTDSWGFPAKMSRRGGKSEDVLINIQLDQWGNDSIVKLVDSEGNLLMNGSGSWIIKNICDKKGNVLENYALNRMGAPMNDYYGNCSWKREVDDYGNTLCSLCYDAGDNPVRISEDYTPDDVPEIHYEYDRWHRMKSQTFFNENKPDTTSQGVHRVEYSYNTHGQILGIKSMGLYGEPKAYGYSNTAFGYYIYDKKGRQISILRLGPDSTYLSTNEYYYRIETSYNEEDLKEKKKYIFDGSDSILWHYEYYSPQVDIYYHRNVEAYIDSLDERGNILSRTFVSQNQDPVLLPDRTPSSHYPYSRFVSTYQYAPHSCTKITTWYDKNGKWTTSNDNYRSPARTIVTTDSLRYTVTHKEYDKDSVLLVHYKEIYDENFNTLKYKQSLTTMGDAGRSGMNDALYYKIKVEYTPTGQVSSILYLNEFDEPAYTYANYKTFCYQVYGNSGEPIYYDENKNVVKESDKPSTPKAACVEITGESGKANGLKDGDILIRYGDWFYSHNQKFYYHFEDLYAQMIFSATKDSVEIWVLRHFSKENESKIIKLHVKGGTSSQIGFAVHEIFYTNKETQRYLRAFIAFKDDEEKAGRPIIKTTKHLSGSYYAKILIPHYSNKYHISSSSSSGWQNPMLMVAAKAKESSGWPKSNNNRIWYYGREAGGLYDNNWSSLLLSDDGASLKRYDFRLFSDYEDISLSEEEHHKVQNLLKQAKKDYSDVFFCDENEYMSDILKSQPSEDAISAYEMVKKYRLHSEKGLKHRILHHIEGIDSMIFFRVYSFWGSDAKKYRDLTYQLDKKRYTSQIAPQDSTQIPEKGIAFLHEASAGIDEILYLSKDTVIWAKGNMTHGSKDIIRKNLLGDDYSPLDKYNHDDLISGDMATKHKIALYWQSLQRYDLSYPVFKKLCKQKYGPSYTALANAYIEGKGCKVDTARAISLYEKALKYGEPIHRELGKLYYDVHKYKSAIPLLKMRANSDSYELLGTIYEYGGNGVKINLDSALYYYKKGYNDDFLRFHNLLNRIREQRLYTPNDFQDLSPLIARSYSADSLFSIGIEYYYGEDYPKAYSYMKAAADSLYPPAEEVFSEFMENKKFGFNNIQKAHEYRQLAIKHYLKYAKQGNKASYRMIARLYETKDVEGKGVDLDSAKHYYELALQHKDYSVAPELGELYSKDYDYTKALNAYLIGAKAGQEDCMFSVAQLYELTFNTWDASFWYQKCYETSEDNEEKEKCKNALERLGVPISYRLKVSEMVGVWVEKGVGVKVFLPSGSFFALYYTDFNNISKELRECQLQPWMYGKFYVNGKNTYIEDIEKRDVYRYLGEQHLKCQINGDVMWASWENKSNETFVKLSDSNSLIKHITQNWDTYKKYLQDNLQYSK